MASIPTPTPAQRQWLYGVATAIVPLLVLFGVITAEAAPLILAAVAAVLATGTATAFTNTGRGTDVAE